MSQATPLILTLCALFASFWSGFLSARDALWPAELCMVAALVLVALVFWPQDDPHGGFGA